MSVSTPHQNPDTVAALLDTTWRVAATESQRTDALDRKAATVSTFASVVAALTAALGVQFVDRVPEWWALSVFVFGLTVLVAAVQCRPSAVPERAPHARRRLPSALSDLG